TESTVQHPSEAVPTIEETRYLLDGVRRGLPGIGWTESDVIGAFSGVRMLAAQDSASLSAVSREFEVHTPRPGLVMHVGGKYTTSRSDSVEIVDAVYRVLGRKPPRAVTHEHVLPGAPAAPFETWQAQTIARLAAAGVDLDAARWLTLRHGNGVDAILELIGAHPEYAARIDE